MIYKRNTYYVSIRYGEHKNNTQGFRVLADSLSIAEAIVKDYLFQENYQDWEITSVTLTGQILGRVDELY